MRRISNNADQIIDLRLIFEGLVVSCIVVVQICTLTHNTRIKKSLKFQSKSSTRIEITLWILRYTGEGQI